jgi:hypothetical protein
MKEIDPLTENPRLVICLYSQALYCVQPSQSPLKLAQKKFARESHLPWSTAVAVFRSHTSRDALVSYRAAQAGQERLAFSDTMNTNLNLATSHVKIGDVLLAQNKLDQALVSHPNSLAISQDPADADPKNADWQADLSVSHSRGAVLDERGSDLAGCTLDSWPRRVRWSRSPNCGPGSICALKAA